MKDRKYLLILGAAQFQRERSLIGALKAYPGKIASIIEDGVFDKQVYFDIAIEGRDTFPVETLEAVKRYEDQTGMTPCAVVPLNDFVLNSGYLISQHYNLAYLKKETIDNCREKNLLKECLISHNLPVVRSCLFESIDELKELIKDLKYPVVIKPLNLGGSGGVKKVSKESELESAYLSMVKIVQAYASDYDSSTNQFVVEIYIQSKAEVSIEVLNSKNGHKVLGVTDKYLSAEPYFSEIAHLVPSVYRENDEMQTVAIKACEVLGIDYGVAHVEMKILDDNTPMIIEVGCRPAGDSIMDIHELSTGVNFYELHIRSYLENVLPFLIEYNSTSAIGYIHPTKGKVFKLNKLKSEKYLKIVKSITLNVVEGDRIEDPKDFSTRYGHIFFQLPLDESFFVPLISQEISNELIKTSSEL